MVQEIVQWSQGPMVQSIFNPLKQSSMFLILYQITKVCRLVEGRNKKSHS